MKREIGKNVFKFIFFALCTYGIIRVSIWSYFQTQAFFIPFDENGNHVISHAIALLAQYGQNVVLFLAMIEAGRRIAYQNKILKISGNRTHIAILEEEIRKSTVASRIYYSLFGVFATIDAGTNLGQFLSTTYEIAKQTIPAGFALVSFVIVGCLISVVVVFVEELFMNAVNAMGHAFNDIVESMGYNRFGSFDLFVDPDKVIATRMDERNGKTQSSGTENNSGSNNNNSSNYSGNGNSQNSNNNKNMSGYPTPRKDKEPQKTYPTQHPIGMSEEDKRILIERLKQNTRAREI